MTYLLPYLAAPQASNAGVLTSIASIITALTVLIGGTVGAAKVLYPMLRETRAMRKETQANTAQLGIIHTLVNSTLTAAQQAVIDGAHQNLYLLEDANRLRGLAGEQTTDDQLALIGATRRRIDELTAAMEERLQQTKMADIQIATEARRTS